MKQKNMWNGLKLDSFGIEISFSKTKKEIISFLKEKNISIDTPTEMQIVIKSTLFSLDSKFFIGFHFSGEKLIAITMSPDMALEGKALYSRYNEIQKALEKELGYPHNHSRLIMNLLDPDNLLARWQSNGIIIEHYILNRFGMEETISIEL